MIKRDAGTPDATAPPKHVIRDTAARIALVAPPIVAQAQAAFPDARVAGGCPSWHLRSQNLELAIRKAALSAQIEARKIARNDPV